MMQGKPQKYSTQYRSAGDHYELYDVDPDTSDEERALWNVPPLAEARRRAETTRVPKASSLGRFPATEELARCQVGDLDVRIHRLPVDLPLGKGPPATPIQPGDPMPWLPPGLAPCRLGAGYGATDGGDEPAVTWARVQQMPDGGFVMYWRHEDGEPRIEPVEVRCRSAAWIDPQREQLGSAIIVPTLTGGHWLVVGRLPREHLLQIAAGLSG